MKFKYFIVKDIREAGIISFLYRVRGDKADFFSKGDIGRWNESWVYGRTQNTIDNPVNKISRDIARKMFPKAFKNKTN